jgi:hypothetical protein
MVEVVLSIWIENFKARRHDMVRMVREQMPVRIGMGNAVVRK